MTESAHAALDRIELLKPLSPQRRAELTRLCRWRRFSAGEQILDERGDGSDVCFIIEGAVRIVSHSVSGRQISFDDIDAGGTVGEMAAIDGQPRSAAVEAVVDGTRIAFLPSRVFREVATSDPGVALAVMHRLSGIARRATERVLELSTLAANNRIHAELLRLARRNFRPNGIAILSPIPTHADLAARVSTTRETVARVLNDLAREGIVLRTSDALVIRDLERLEAMVAEVRA